LKPGKLGSWGTSQHQEQGVVGHNPKGLVTAASTGRGRKTLKNGFDSGVKNPTTGGKGTKEDILLQNCTKLKEFHGVSKGEGQRH